MECDDFFDNDNDGQHDFPHDPGCSSSIDDSESESFFLRMKCSVGFDDDVDAVLTFETGSADDNPSPTERSSST